MCRFELGHTVWLDRNRAGLQQYSYRCVMETESNTNSIYDFSVFKDAQHILQFRTTLFRTRVEHFLNSRYCHLVYLSNLVGININIKFKQLTHVTIGEI